MAERFKKEDEYWIKHRLKRHLVKRVLIVSCGKLMSCGGRLKWSGATG